MMRMDEGLLKKFNEIELIHWWWEGRRQLVTQFLKGRRPQKILDVGCGTGETISFLKKLFPKAKFYGVDSSSSAIKFSKLRGHKNILKSLAEKLPFKDKTFDVILFLDVLEHISDDQKVINEAKRVLKKNGSIIITSPALNFIWSAHDTDQGHKRRYTRRAIRKLSSNAGLKTDFISYFNFFLSPPIIAIRLLSNIKKLRYLSNYDSGLNFEIAKKSFVNSILRLIFVTEVKMLKFLRYPIGISIGAKLTKTK
jgi:ubiquinone/menaquinone biosynthesis C-methylase UbiE